MATHGVIKRTLVVACALLIAQLSYAQDFSAGVNIDSPNPNAVLHLVSPGNNQGILIPQLTTAQRTGMSLSATDSGILVYDSDLNAFFFWVNGVGWQEVANTTGLDLSQILTNGADAGGNVINNVGEPVVAQDVATKNYVDTNEQDNQNLSNVLGEGNDAGGFQIINVADPINPQDVATRNYVDSRPDADNQDLISVLSQGNSAGGNVIDDLGAPVNPNDAVTKSYVDALTSSDLNTVLGFGNDAGGSQIVNVSDPTNDQDVATKFYVDNIGDSDNQDLFNVLTISNDAGGSQIVNVSDPTNDQDVATKFYVDNIGDSDNQDLFNVLTISNDAGASQITNLGDPTNPQDAATANYVDNQISGLGTAATQNVGTGLGEVLQFATAGTLPALDGSALTGVNAVIGAGAVSNFELAANSVQSGNIDDGTIVDADVNISAAIAGTKIDPDFGSQSITTTGTFSGDGSGLTNLNLDIVNADVNASAAIAGSKIDPDFGSQNIVTTGTITGDGSGLSNLNLDIVNADVNASAAIAGSKIDPDFGSQNIVTTGTITGDGSGLSNLNLDIVNADINNSAGIDVTKLSSGIIDNTEFNNLNGLNQGLSTTANVTFNQVAGTLTTAAQTNITSVGTLAGATVSGASNLNGNVTIGDAAADVVTVNGELAGASPLVFEGGTDDGNTLTFAITDPGGTNTLTFPDVTGTVFVDGVGLSALTATEVTQLANIDANTISNAQWGYLGGTNQALATTDNVTFNQVGGTLTTAAQTNITSVGTLTGATVSGASNLNGNVTIGDAAADVVTVNGELAGANPLVFEGGTDDGNTLTLAVSEPGGTNTITLPDVTGTLFVDGSGLGSLTTGEVTQLANIDANTISNAQWGYLGGTNQALATTDNVTFNQVGGTLTTASQTNITSVGTLTGATVSGASNLNGNVTIGDAAADVVTVNGELAGASPLVFEGGTDDGNTLTLAVSEPGGTNTITLPDVTGTLFVDGSGLGSLTTGEVTQLANIDANTISNAQWGYLGGTNQALATTDNVIFNQVGGTLTTAAQTNITSVGTLTGATVSGASNLNGNVTIGDAAADVVTVNGELAGANPLVFEGGTDDGNTLTLAISEPGGTNTITLPDATGTLFIDGSGLGSLTTGEVTQLANIDANTISNAQWGYLGGTNQALSTTDNVTFNQVGGTLTTAAQTNITSVGILTGATVSGASNLNGDVTLGDAAADAVTLNGDLTVNGEILGSSPFVFQGATDNVNTITLDVGDPSGVNTITLPDATGTLFIDGSGLGSLTTGEVTQLANIDANTISNAQWGYLGGTNQALATTDNVTFNQVAGTLTTAAQTNITSVGTLTGATVSGASNLNGDVTLGDAAADAVTLNGDLTVNGEILGSSPFVFQGATDNANTTTLDVGDPSGVNTITLPDATGTLFIDGSGLGSLTTGEVTQLANIDANTISNAQWGYLGGTDQGLATTNSVNFGQLGISASNTGSLISVTNTDGATGTAASFTSDGAVPVLSITHTTGDQPSLTANTGIVIGGLTATNTIGSIRFNGADFEGNIDGTGTGWRSLNGINFPASATLADAGTLLSIANTDATTGTAASFTSNAAVPVVSITHSPANQPSLSTNTGIVIGNLSATNTAGSIRFNGADFEGNIDGTGTGWRNLNGINFPTTASLADAGTLLSISNTDGTTGTAASFTGASASPAVQMTNSSSGTVLDLVHTLGNQPSLIANTGIVIGGLTATNTIGSIRFNGADFEGNIDGTGTGWRNLNGINFPATATLADAGTLLSISNTDGTTGTAASFTGASASPAVQMTNSSSGTVLDLVHTLGNQPSLIANTGIVIGGLTATNTIGSIRFNGADFEGNIDGTGTGWRNLNGINFPATASLADAGTLLSISNTDGTTGTAASFTGASASPAVQMTNSSSGTVLDLVHTLGNQPSLTANTGIVIGGLSATNTIGSIRFNGADFEGNIDGTGTGWRSLNGINFPATASLADAGTLLSISNTDGTTGTAGSFTSDGAAPVLSITHTTGDQPSLDANTGIVIGNLTATNAFGSIRFNGADFEGNIDGTGTGWRSLNGINFPATASLADAGTLLSISNTDGTTGTAASFTGASASPAVQMTNSSSGTVLDLVHTLGNQPSLTANTGIVIGGLTATNAIGSIRFNGADFEGNIDGTGTGWRNLNQVNFPATASLADAGTLLSITNTDGTTGTAGSFTSDGAAPVLSITHTTGDQPSLDANTGIVIGDLTATNAIGSIRFGGGTFEGNVDGTGGGWFDFFAPYFTTEFYEDADEIVFGSFTPVSAPVSRILQVIDDDYGLGGAALGAATFNSTDLTMDHSTLALLGSRGDQTSPVAIDANDVLGQVLFEGYDGAFAQGGYMNVMATEDWTLGNGAQMSFGTTEEGTAAGSTERLRITHDGEIRVRGDLVNPKPLILENEDGTGWAGFQATAGATSSVVWSLPDGDGALGQVMATDNSGNLDWVDAVSFPYQATITSGSPLIDLDNDGTGGAARFAVSNTGGAAAALSAVTLSNTGYTGYFQSDNTGNTSPVILALHSGTGSSFEALNTNPSGGQSSIRLSSFQASSEVVLSGSNGDASTPAVLTPGETIGGIVYEGYDGASNTTALVEAVATGLWDGGGDRGSALSFSATPSGTGTPQHMARLEDYGFLVENETAQARLEAISAGGLPSMLELFSGRGSIGIPSEVQDFDVIGEIVISGYEGLGTYSPGVRLAAEATENWGTSNNGTAIVLQAAAQADDFLSNFMVLDADNISMGYRANAAGTATGSIAIGSGISGSLGAEAYSLRGVAIGYDSYIGTASNDGIAFGYNATINDNASEAIAIGLGAVAGDATNGTRAIAIGSSADAIHTDAMAIGFNATARDQRSVAIGFGANTAVGVTDVVALGTSAQTDGMNGIAIGAGSRVNNTDGIGIGRTATADADNAIAIGAETTANQANSIILGDGTPTSYSVGINTASPGASLDVNGSARVSANLTLDGNLISTLDGPFNADPVASDRRIVTLDGGPITEIAAGINGQEIILVSQAGGVTLVDVDNTGTNIQLANNDPSVVMNVNATIHLVYVGSFWIEISRSLQ